MDNSEESLQRVKKISIFQPLKAAIGVIHPRLAAKASSWRVRRVQKTVNSTHIECVSICFSFFLIEEEGFNLVFFEKEKVTSKQISFQSSYHIIQDINDKSKMKGRILLSDVKQIISGDDLKYENSSL